MAYPNPLTKEDIWACPDRASYLQLVMPYYQAACKQYGIRYPGVMALQGIYEVGLPNCNVGSFKNDNNAGGLKYGSGIPNATPGSVSSEGDRYSHFESVDKYIEAAVWNVGHEGSYYSEAMAATDMKDFALKLIRVWVDGTDAYAWDVIADYEKYGLASYENDGSGAVSGASGAASGSDQQTTPSAGGGLAGLTFTTEHSWTPETSRTEEGGHEGLKTFYRINMSGAQFIKQVLAPYCKSKETGQSGYRLWFDDETSPDGAPGTKLYFKPDQYANITNTASEKILEDIDRTYQFSFGTGPTSSVKSFTFDYSGLVTAFLGGSEVEGETLEAVTNDLIYTKYNRYIDENRPSTGDSVFDDLMGTYRIGDSSYTMDELATKASTLWANMSSYGYTAEMTVFGDPWIETQSVCSITNLTPKGMPHHSSGIYLIYKAVDSISGGTFETTLSLVRNAMDIGLDDSGGLVIDIAKGDTRFIGQAATLMGASPGTADSGNTQNNTSSSGSFNAVAANEVIQKAVDWALAIAADDSHGYNWGGRGPGDYDCSGLVTSAYNQAGLSFGTPGTSGMRAAMLPYGFVAHPELCNGYEGAQVGDVYINEGVHTAMYIGNGKIVHAAGSENRGNGNWMYGSPGDQTGKEILVADWYDDAWTIVLRYEGKAS